MKILARIFTRASMICVLVAFCVPGFLYSQGKLTSTDKLIKESDVIIQGKVGGAKTEWNSKHDRIQTRVTIVVDQAMKGSVPGNLLTVLVPGGEIDGVGEWYSHVVRFDTDEEVVLFAKQDKAGLFKVAGGESGKFTVKKDARTGSKIISNIGTLESFTSKIKNAVKLQQSGIGKEQ